MYIAYLSSILTSINTYCLGIEGKVVLETLEHQLQRFDPGIVWLDADNQIMGMNSVATNILGADAEAAIGLEILQFHPEKSRSKVKWLLEETACPVESPPPMTMMINIPDRVLLIKVSKVLAHKKGVGTCMVFYDLTEMTTAPHKNQVDSDKPRLLFKLPVQKHKKVMLVDLDEVINFKAEGHYTTVYTKDEEYLCNLSLSELEVRLPSDKFVRVHRSHMANIHFAKTFEKVDEQCSIVMMNGVMIPISRSKVKMLKIMLGLD